MRVQAATQVPPGLVWRVADVPAPGELLLLPATADLVQRGLGELHDAEGISTRTACGRLTVRAVG